MGSHNNNKLHLGLPSGSLNTPGRGDTEGLFIDAGYDIVGYAAGREHRSQLAILNDDEISPHLVKAANVPGDLSRGLLDLSITGDDCIYNWPGGAGEFTKIVDLEYGNVQVVVAVPKDSEIADLTGLLFQARDHEEPQTFYTEYPILTRNYLMDNDGYQELYPGLTPKTEVFGYVEGDNDKVQIIHSQGATEAYLGRGFPIVDNTQSGTSLQRAGGVKLEVIMKSSAGLYSRRNIVEDPWKADKVTEVGELLSGVINGRKHYDVKFNVDSDDLDRILMFLKQERLALKGPTVAELLDVDRRTIGYAVNIAVPKSRYLQVRARLREKGATGILCNLIKQVES
jgi:ATP phosphoribosyltransferase-like protein